MGLKLPPKGRGRKSNIETYRDAMAVVKLVDHDCMEVADAAKALGLTVRTAYRLLSRARSMFLKPQIEANKKASEPKVKDWYEAAPPTSAFNSDPEPVDRSLTTEGVVGPQDDHGTTGYVMPSSTNFVEHVDTRRTSAAKFAARPQVRPYTPEPKPVRNPNEDEATWRVRWRRWQVTTQIEENMLQGAPTGIVLRGGRPTNLPCFGKCPIGFCTCHSEGPFNE